MPLLLFQTVNFITTYNHAMCSSELIPPIPQSHYPNLLPFLDSAHSHFPCSQKIILPFAFTLQEKKIKLSLLLGLHWFPSYPHYPIITSFSPAPRRCGSPQVGPESCLLLPPQRSLYAKHHPPSPSGDLPYSSVFQPSLGHKTCSDLSDLEKKNKHCNHSHPVLFNYWSFHSPIHPLNKL